MRCRGASVLSWLLVWGPFTAGVAAGLAVAFALVLIGDRRLSEMLKWFFESNGWGGRLARTVVQAAIGFVLAYVNELVALLNVGDSTQALIVAAVMMILSPIMQMIGSHMPAEEEEGGDV